MINFDDYTNENKLEHNSNWPYMPDHPYRILIIDGFGSGKTNAENLGRKLIISISILQLCHQTVL